MQNIGLWFIITTPSDVNYRFYVEGPCIPATGSKCLFNEKFQFRVHDIVHHIDGETLTCAFVYIKPDDGFEGMTEEEITSIGFERRDF